MIRWFRAFAEHVQDLVRAVGSIADALERVGILLAERQSDDGTDRKDLDRLDDRLDDLERSRALWEANMEAELVRADSTYKAARNAESRARTQLKALDESDEDGMGSEEELRQAYAALGLVPAGDAEASDPNGLQHVRPDLEGEPAKAPAMRAKFGV